MIGIAMTSYNGEKYLKEQIDSILNQTVSDFELIVCDDVSSDSTMDILNGYAAKDSRVHVFRNEENLGFLKNFEKNFRKHLVVSNKTPTFALAFEKQHLQCACSSVGRASDS